MTHPGEILVPVAVSSRSVRAAQYAASLDSEFNSELLSIHALGNGWPLDEAAMNVRDVVMTVRGSTPGRFIIREGEPVPVILESATPRTWM